MFGEGRGRGGGSEGETRCSYRSSQLKGDGDWRRCGGFDPDGRRGTNSDFGNCCCEQSTCSTNTGRQGRNTCSPTCSPGRCVSPGSAGALQTVSWPLVLHAGPGPRDWPSTACLFQICVHVPHKGLHLSGKSLVCAVLIVPNVVPCIRSYAKGNISFCDVFSKSQHKTTATSIGWLGVACVPERG